MTYDILVYGPIFCDLIFTDLPGMPALGTEIFAGDLTASVGGSAIVAAVLHNLGVRVGLIAELGSDPFSDVLRRLLDELGLDRSLIREHPHPLPQVTAALSFAHDRAFVTRFQRPAAPPDLAAILYAHPAKHLHVCSFLAALETPDACAIAHAAGMTVSMDPGWDEAALRDPRLAAMIADLDLFMPSEMELCHIAGARDVTTAVAQTHASMRRGALVLKQGAAGATAYPRDGQPPVHTPALAVQAIDTTGAGDAFDAGFLSRYVQGAPLEACMRAGVVCGGIAVTAPGITRVLPNFKGMEAWFAKLPSSAAAAPTHPA